MSGISRRNALAFLGSAVAASGYAAQTGIARGDTPANAGGSDLPADLSYVNPALRKTFRAMLTGQVSAPEPSLEDLRKGAKYPLTFPAVPVVVAQTIPGPRGAADVKIYVINSRSNGNPRPAILHTHGGGFIAGSARSSVPALQKLALELDCVIVTVEYRLAPETPFPGALEDNYAALLWLYRNAVSLDVDSQRIALMGESAGGGHAAMLAIAARDRGEVPLVLQALVYPMLDDRTGSSRPIPPRRGEVTWTARANKNGWTAFLGQPAGSFTVPYGSVPARVDNLKGLAPAFIAVGTIDLFLDEDVDYARRLIDAGVLTDLHLVPGAFHGFELFAPASDIAKSFHANLLAAFRQAFVLSA